MSAAVLASSGVDRCRGVRQIVEFNWPRYAAAVPLALVMVGVALVLPMPSALGWACAMGGGLLLWWTAASLAVSHWVYDRSGLYDLAWLPALGVRGGCRWAMIHAGLDEFSVSLAERLGADPVVVLDIYDPATMGEPSIVRARDRERRTGRLFGTAATHDRLPVGDASLDAVFLIMAAHEIRSGAGRAALLAEVRRALAPDGTVIVVEHLRDGANAAAFGPGAMHFVSRGRWIEAFAAAGLRIDQETGWTPFVRIFKLGRG